MLNRQQQLPVGVVTLCVAVLLFVLLGWLPLINALLILGFALSAYGYTRTAGRFRVHQFAWLATFLLGVFVATHRPAEFLYPLVAREPFLHLDGEPFELRVNLSKALAGWALVALLVRQPAQGQSPWIRRPLYQWALVSCVVATIILFAHINLGLAWVPKLPKVTFTFILVNIAVTSVAEEAFFRLLLQRHLASLFQHRILQLCIPVAVASLLFALTHRLALDALFVVYLVAGLGYALVYALTQRFVAAVAVHAGVNIAHFLLLPYPLPVNV